MSKTPSESKKRPAGSLMDYFEKAAAAASPAAASKTTASPSKAAKKARVADEERATAAAAEEIDDPFAFADEDEATPAPVAAAPAATPKRSSSGGSSSIKSKHAASSSSAAAPSPAAPAAVSKKAASIVHMEISDNEEDEAPVPKKAAAPAAAAASSSAKPKSAASSAASPATASRPASSAAAAAAKPSSSSSAVAATPSPSKAAAAAAATAAAAEAAKQRAAQAAEAERERKKQQREQERKREAAASSSAAAAAASVPVPAAAAATAASSSPSKKSAAKPRKPKAAAASQKKSNDGSDLAKKVSKDVDVVLAPVMRLKAEMAREDARGVKALTLADLNLPNVKTDVKSLNAAEVRAQIERAAVECINSIMAGHGFHYDIPARTSANQMYVAVLDRIVLKDKTSAREFVSLKNGHKSAITTRILQLIYELCLKKIHVTKRDLFYTDVKLFGKQTATDEVIEDVAAMIGSTRSSLNVVASEKGVVVGQIQFKDDGDFIDCTRMGVGGKAIPPSIDRVTEISGLAKFVLLVEKDAAFMRLAEDRFYNQFPCIIITAKGQPDVATRLFLKKVKETLRIPVLGLFDADPYGLKILSVYVSGSKNMSYDSASLTTPDIKWLGIRPSDLDRYNIPAQCRLQMSEHDIKTGKELLEEDFIKKNPEWLSELEMMVRSKEKAEIQALVRGKQLHTCSTGPAVSGGADSN